MVFLIVLLALIFLPSLLAALLSGVFKILVLLFKLAFTFWQVALTVLLLWFLAGLIA